MAKLTQKSRYPQHVFTDWVKALGPLPSEAQLSVAHVFGRPGKQALGIAMALRDCGMTSSQMTSASALFDGKATTCRNKIKAEIAAGMFDGGASNGVIKITLTPRGQQHIDRLAARGAGDAEPAPGKAVAKSVKRQAKKAARKPRKPASEAPVTLTEQVPAGAGDGTGEPAQA